LLITFYFSSSTLLSKRFYLNEIFPRACVNAYVYKRMVYITRICPAKGDENLILSIRALALLLMSEVPAAYRPFLQET